MSTNKVYIYLPQTQEEALDSDANHLENISDILLCDMAGYAPNKSCDPDVAGRQVFNIGKLMI